MPLTFIDIERQKNWRIVLFFLVLMLLYVCMSIFFAAMFFHAPWNSTPQFWTITVFIAILIAGFHFWLSASDTVGIIIRQLEAQPPDPDDAIHRMLINIIEEMHVVTGNRIKIQCMVIPSLSLNALAVVDLKGRAVIGITEGLLSRLKRPQLESVIAHEAHHILSGDCLESSVAASLFGTYAGFIDKMRYASQGRIFALPGFLFAWAMLRLSHLLNMFISREREYRADSAAVRMTRNPVALAEALYLLSRSWRGAGFISSGLETICIVNPTELARDESEGMWADLVSTHPPIRKRIDILLKMAQVSLADLDHRTSAKTGPVSSQESDRQYFAISPQHQWEGPFTLGELSALPWLSPLTWITVRDRQLIQRAWKDPVLSTLFTARLAGKEKTLSHYVCPTCNQRLIMLTYEGAGIFQCSFCSGILIENDKISRVIARAGRERSCSDRINSLAKTEVIRNQAKLSRSGRRIPDRTLIHLLACPQCTKPMHRRFFSAAHLIEVDRCSFCSLTWFEQDELAMLQCMILNRITPDTNGNQASVFTGNSVDRRQ